MPGLLKDLRHGVLTLTLNRPERANAFDAALIVDLLAALNEAAADAAVRCIVLTGAGAVFSSGQDLEEMLRAAGRISYREHLERTYNPLILALRRIEKPALAAVNGPCAGAALGVALACDLRIASEAARFVVGFAGLALAPDTGVSLLLPATIGLGRAAQATLTNAPIPAAQALEWGLVSRVVAVEALPAAAAELATGLAAGPTGAFGLTKKAFNSAFLPNLEQALGVEADLQEIAGRKAEHLEGVRAFAEKRRPDFS